MALEDTRRGNVPTPNDPFAAVLELTARNRARPDLETEGALLNARHDAFLKLERSEPRPLQSDGSSVPPDAGVGLPVIHGAPSAELVRAAIAGHGSVIVRQLIGRERAAELRRGIEASLAAREAFRSGAPRDPSRYTEFEHIGSTDCRAFTSEGGILAADSPRGHFEMVETLRDAGIVEIATALLGERPAVSVEKCVLRRIEPQIYASWHQDGAFLGERISTLDVWIALSRCGRTAPGLEILPRRVDRVLPTGAFFSWDLSEEVLAREYPGVSPVMPEFDAGDAIIFDQLCVHRSGHRAGMTDPRFALECWLFAPSSLPSDYTGLLL